MNTKLPQSYSPEKFGARGIVLERRGKIQKDQPKDALPEYLELLEMLYQKSASQKEIKKRMTDLGMEYVSDPIEQLMVISDKAELFPDKIEEDNHGANL